MRRSVSWKANWPRNAGWHNAVRWQVCNVLGLCLLLHLVAAHLQHRCQHPILLAKPPVTWGILPVLMDQPAMHSPGRIGLALRGEYSAMAAHRKR